MADGRWQEGNQFSAICLLRSAICLLIRHPAHAFVHATIRSFACGKTDGAFAEVTVAFLEKGTVTASSRLRLSLASK